jgi:hypothetical protein
LIYITKALRRIMPFLNFISLVSVKQSVRSISAYFRTISAIFLVAAWKQGKSPLYLNILQCELMGYIKANVRRTKLDGGWAVCAF